MKSSEEKKEQTKDTPKEQPAAQTPEPKQPESDKQTKGLTLDQALKQLDDARVKTQEDWDKLLRLKADFENTRKRLERDKQEAIRFANEKLLAEILPVVDNLDRAMTSLSEGHDPDKVKKGLKIASEELHQVLEEYGVEIVKTGGARFDPRFHEAVAVVETPEVQDGMIIDEIQRGYLLNGRLIRPSRVRVGQKKSSNTGDEP